MSLLSFAHSRAMKFAVQCRRFMCVSEKNLTLIFVCSLFETESKREVTEPNLNLNGVLFVLHLNPT